MIRTTSIAFVGFENSVGVDAKARQVIACQTDLGQLRNQSGMNASARRLRTIQWKARSQQRSQCIQQVNMTSSSDAGLKRSLCSTNAILTSTSHDGVGGMKGSTIWLKCQVVEIYADNLLTVNETMYLCVDVYSSFVLCASRQKSGSI